MRTATRDRRVAADLTRHTTVGLPSPPPRHRRPGSDASFRAAPASRPKTLRSCAETPAGPEGRSGRWCRSATQCFIWRPAVLAELSGGHAILLLANRTHACVKVHRCQGDAEPDSQLRQRAHDRATRRAMLWRRWRPSSPAAHARKMNDADQPSRLADVWASSAGPVSCVICPGVRIVGEAD